MSAESNETGLAEEEKRHPDSRAEDLRALVIAALNPGFSRAEILSPSWQDIGLASGPVTAQEAYAKNGENHRIRQKRNNFATRPLAEKARSV